MSATLPRFVAEFMFGDGLDYYDVGNVETQGKIVQYRERALANITWTPIWGFAEAC